MSDCPPLSRPAFDPWLDMTGRKAVADVPHTLTRAPDRGASAFHSRLSLLHRDSKCGGNEGEEDEYDQ